MDPISTHKTESPPSVLIRSPPKLTKAARKNNRSILAGSFACWLRCELVTDPRGYAPRSRLASQQNFRAIIAQIIFSRCLRASQLGALAHIDRFALCACWDIPIFSVSWWQGELRLRGLRAKVPGMALQEMTFRKRFSPKRIIYPTPGGGGCIQTAPRRKRANPSD
jgi:hypothetical protein